MNWRAWYCDGRSTSRADALSGDGLVFIVVETEGGPRILDRNWLCFHEGEWTTSNDPKAPEGARVFARTPMTDEALALLKKQAGIVTAEQKPAKGKHA
jgi:hypothetical protein